MSFGGLGIKDKGPFVAQTKKKRTPAGQYWADMLMRCYGACSLSKNPSYLDCEVHPDFLHFQKFAAWAHEQHGFLLPNYCLDKDLLVKGNKVYGPDACVFLPREVNGLLIRQASRRGEYPIGVSKLKRNGLFRAMCSIDKKQTQIGTFDNPVEAFEAYKAAKEGVIQKAAKKYKQEIDPRAYEALMNYEVEISD